MLFMCFYGAIRQTNMATDSFNIYLSPVGVKSLNRFVINWQAGAKLIRNAHEYNGFVTLNASTIKNVMTCLKGTRGYHWSRFRTWAQHLSIFTYLQHIVVVHCIHAYIYMSLSHQHYIKHLSIYTNCLIRNDHSLRVCNQQIADCN